VKLKRRAAVIGLVALVCASSAHGAASDTDPPCSQTPVAGSRGVQLPYAGGTRFFQLHVPPNVAVGRHLALVLALHGAGSTGPKMERYSGFSAQADKYGFAVAYPSAAGPLWNIAASQKGADDVGFIAAVIGTVESSLCIDPKRVYATGVSNGAGMVELLGCAISRQLTAIAPVEGVYSGQPACHPSRPVSVLEIHGTADRIAPYYGDDLGTAASGVPPIVRGWVHRDACGRSSSTKQLAARSTLYAWGRCNGSTSVEHVRILGGSHQWPGATPPDPGPASTFCGACVIWGFFASLRPSAASRTGGAGIS